MANKVKFTVISEKFEDFIDKLSDLTSIDDTIKLKIDNDNILMYSMLGGNVMLAFKNYLIDKSEYLQSDELDFTYDVIIANSKKFVKNLGFIKSSDKVTIEINCKESPEDDTVMNARSIQVVGGKLKVNWLAGERYEMRDINKTVLAQRLDIKHRKWAFELVNQDFMDVKKLSSINSDKIININVQSGKVILSETSAWELEVGEIENRNANLIFNKRFLNCINDELEIIEFSMFETFILIKDDNSNLMLSYEQDFSDDDV
jgi:hypothetical protein